MVIKLPEHVSAKEARTFMRALQPELERVEWLVHPAALPQPSQGRISVQSLKQGLAFAPPALMGDPGAPLKFRGLPRLNSRNYCYSPSLA